MTCSALRKQPFNDPGRAGRSLPGVKNRKRSFHRRVLLGHSPQKRGAYQLRPGSIPSGRGRRNRINERLPKAACKSFRDEEPTYYHDEDYITSGEEESEEDFFWEEEHTLFSDLMEGADDKEHKGQDWTDLLDTLQDAFAENSIVLKKETACGFVPTVTRMKEIFRVCDEQDRAYGEGILMLNSTLKKYEMTVIKTEDNVKEAHGSARNKIGTILQQLEDTYSQRDKLWSGLHEKIAQIAEPVAQILKEVPTNIERIIAAQEKKSRNQEKEDGNSTLLNEDMLKELLKKL